MRSAGMGGFSSIFKFLMGLEEGCPTRVWSRRAGARDLCLALSLCAVADNIDLTEKQAMTNKKQERRDPVSIEHDDKIYTGECIISGTRKLFFKVEYKGRALADSRTWETSQEELYNLRVMARAHLVRLVFEVERL